jgi:hypothetical protein
VVTKRRTTGTRSGRSRTRRSTPGSGYRTRRRTPKTSTTLGGAFALALVALFAKTSWPVRIGIVVVAVIALAAFLVLRARSGGGAGPDQQDPPPDAPPGPPTPADKDAPS